MIVARSPASRLHEVGGEADHEEDRETEGEVDPDVDPGQALGDRSRLDQSEVELGAEPGGEDPGERVRVLQERGHEDQQRRHGQELAQPDVDDGPGEEVDETGGEQHTHRLPDDPAYDRLLAAEPAYGLDETDRRRRKSDRGAG
jgi:hypothetical protein